MHQADGAVPSRQVWLAVAQARTIDIRYSYGSSSGEGKTLLVFHTSNNREALDTLK